jgi:hypothetical protein
MSCKVIIVVLKRKFNNYSADASGDHIPLLRNVLYLGCLPHKAKIAELVFENHKINLNDITILQIELRLEILIERKYK